MSITLRGGFCRRISATGGWMFKPIRVSVAVVIAYCRSPLIAVELCSARRPRAAVPTRAVSLQINRRLSHFADRLQRIASTFFGDDPLFLVADYVEQQR